MKLVLLFNPTPMKIIGFASCSIAGFIASSYGVPIFGVILIGAFYSIGVLLMSDTI